MEKVSLYRKYRPHNFDNLVGQDHIKNTLIHAILNGNVSHAYLFTGPRGTGKTSTARLIAKALCCTNLKDNYEPCDECEFCLDINDGSLIDMIEIDAASNRGIDEVRDLKEKISFAPTRAKVKIYIIDEAHMMTPPAFNALLKTLEEPPDHTYFVLATTEVHKIPDTIISRCQRFDFRRIGKKTLMTRLSFIAQKEEIKADDTALELISRYVDGGLRDAIGLMEQLTVSSELKYEYVQDILGLSSLALMEEMFENLITNNAKSALKIVQELHNQGTDLKRFSYEFVELIREKLLDAIAEDDAINSVKYLRLIETFKESQDKMESSIPQLPLEVAIIKATTADMKIVPEESPVVTQDVPKKTVEKIPEKKPTIEEMETAGVSDDQPVLDMANLLERWPRITERVKRPSLRMSLKNGLPIGVDGYKITLEFNTKFHRDQVMDHENRVEFESIVKDLFGRAVKVNATVKELEIKSMVDEQSGDDELTNEALKIFGGKLME